MTKTVYIVKITFDSKYSKEMHGLFDVGRIGELVKCYSETGVFYNINPHTPEKGIRIESSIVMEVEDIHTCFDCDIEGEELDREDRCSNCAEEYARARAEDHAEAMRETFD